MPRRAVGARGKASQFDFDQIDRRKVRSPVFSACRVSSVFHRLLLAPLSAPKSTLRLRLALLVAGTLLPLILFASGVVYLNHMRARDAAFDRVIGGRARHAARARHRDAGRHAGARGSGQHAGAPARRSRGLPRQRRGLSQELSRPVDLARHPRWPADREHRHPRRRARSAPHQPAFDRGGVLDRPAGLLRPVHRLGDAPPHHHRQRSGDPRRPGRL